MAFHIPVLLNEVLESLDLRPGQTVFDGTAGGGGHSSAIAEKIGETGTVIALDLDPQALEEAKKIFEIKKLKTKLVTVHDNYNNIRNVLTAQGIPFVDAILADVGISSYDIDSSGRGFSFQKDEPLDMRFNPDQPRTAKYILDTYQEKELAQIFKEYGEENFSKRIAKGIVARRQEGGISTSAELFDLIKHALPGPIRFKAADSARRIFQALRIEVNQELENLSTFLPAAFASLKQGGRMGIISFHSLEDRIVKRYFLELQKGCICPPDFPKCVCGKEPLAKVINKKPITASEREIQENPRSRPAKLRVIQKI